MKEQIEADWLTNKIAVAKAQGDDVVVQEHPGPRTIATGYSPKALRSFFPHMQPGDELWEFASGGDSWRNLAGRGGIALCRNGQVIDSTVTIMN